MRGSGEPNGSEPHVSKITHESLLNSAGIVPFPPFAPLAPFASLIFCYFVLNHFVLSKEDVSIGHDFKPFSCFCLFILGLFLIRIV